MLYAGLGDISKCIFEILEVFRRRIFEIKNFRIFEEEFSKLKNFRTISKSIIRKVPNAGTEYRYRRYFF